MVLKLYGLKCIMIVIPIYCVESFIEYLSSVADRINQENITCTIMGDFNIDLLKLEPHLATDRLNSLILWDPFLNTGTKFALLKSLGTTPVEREAVV